MMVRSWELLTPSICALSVSITVPRAKCAVTGTHGDIHVVRRDVSRAEVGEQGLGVRLGVVSGDEVAGGENGRGADMLDDGVDDHELRVGLGGLAEVDEDVLRVLVGPVVEDVAEDDRVGGAGELGLRLEEVGFYERGMRKIRGGLRY